MRKVIGEVVRWGWTYIFIGLWFSLGGAYSGDGLEAVLGVILVFYGALILDRKAKRLEEELEKLRSKKDG
ncbi:MAG: hypothetical protein QW613_06775 [Thermoprotei archaeon]